MNHSRLAVVPSGAVDIDIIDALNKQCRIAHAIMLAVISADRGGSSEGIEDLCCLHIEELRKISEALQGGDRS